MIKTQKGKDPNIHIIDGIHNIKGRTYVNVLSQITPTNMSPVKGNMWDIWNQLQKTCNRSWKILDHLQHKVLPQKMMAKKAEPDIFKLPCHKLRKDIETKLEEQLKEYQSQFTQDETTIGMTPLTKMTIDTRDSEPVSQKTICNCDETLQMS